MLRPDSGTIYVLGKPLDGRSCEYKKQVGFAFEQPCFIECLTGYEYLKLAAHLYGLDTRAPLFPDTGWDTIGLRPIPTACVGN